MRHKCPHDRKFRDATGRRCRLCRRARENPGAEGRMSSDEKSRREFVNALRDFLGKEPLYLEEM